MKNQQFRKLFKLKTKNSGFTLLELLTGSIMSGIVITVLGVGLYQVLKVTSEDTAKSKAGEQASRAIEFITDEIRSAKTIEPNADNANTFDTTDKTVVLALEIPEISSDQMVDIDGDSSTGMLGSDNDTDTTERIVYYLKSTDLGSWKGPQVLYRWGPPLNANGDYTENEWTEEALIDGIDDTVIDTNPCDTGAGEILNPALADNPSGFYACISSGNNAAQIFLTGEVSTVGEQETNFTSDTKIVTRVKEADVVGKKENLTTQFGVEGLGSDFNCNPQSSTNWTMRTDFSQLEDNPTQDRWIYDPDLRGKAFEFDRTKPLSITSIPIGASNCTNTKFDGKDNGSLAASDSWHDTDGDGPVEAKDIVYTKHTIDFNNPYTFNGNGKLSDGTDYDSVDVRTEDTNGDEVIDSNDEPNPQVKVLKQGSEVPNVGGFDANGDGVNDQPSLGEFLAQKGYAYLDPNDNKYKMYDPEKYNEDNTNLNKKLLGNDQRIIAFEIGQDYQVDNPNNNGFDLQDNIFVVTSDAFEKQFESSDLE